MHVYDYMFYIALNSAFTTVQARMHSKKKRGVRGGRSTSPKSRMTIYTCSHMRLTYGTVLRVYMMHNMHLCTLEIY